MLTLPRSMLRNGRPSALLCSAFLPHPSLTPGGPSQCLNSGPRSEPGVGEGLGLILDGPSSSHRASCFPPDRVWADFASGIRPSRPIVRGICHSTVLRAAPGPSSAPVVSRKVVLADRRSLRLRDPRLFRAALSLANYPLGKPFGRFYATRRPPRYHSGWREGPRGT